MTKIAHNYQTNADGLQFGHSELAHAQTAADETVTAGKVTLAGLGEDMTGATELMNHSQIEYQRAVEYADLAQLDVTTDGQANEIQLSTGNQVGRLFNNA